MLETRLRTALAITGFSLLCGAAIRGAVAQAPAAATQTDVAELKAEIEALRGMLPSQSHSMVDVEFQFANLWFAGKAPELAARYVLSQRDTQPFELDRPLAACP